VPLLIIDPFANEKNEAPAKFTISGKTVAFATIELFITPDNMAFSVKADVNGLWKSPITVPLAPGYKKLTVRAIAPNGGTNTATVEFIVVKKQSFVWIWFLLLLIAMYLIYRYIRKRIEPGRG
jgi:hypothetical protein